MTMRLLRLTAVLSLLLPAACRQAPSGPIALGVPGLANAHVTLASDGDRVAAAWAGTGPDGTDVFVALSADGARTFGAPVRVNDTPGDASANGEQPPRVLLRGSAVDVLWVSKRAGVSGIRAASSSDGGRTFAATRSISPDGVSGARGWESAALGPDGAVHAVWLDGRAAARPAAVPGAAAGPHHHGDMRQDIYHATWKGSAAPAETPVAANVCFCCKTAVVTHGAAVFVAWRHLFPGGVRDIAVARSTDGGATFQPPVRVSEDNWQIDACPDDGPAMTVDAGGALRVTWPTLVKDPDGPRMAIFAATSTDGGATFSPRTRIDAAAGGPAHPKLATTAGGRSAVVWDELAGGIRRVMFRAAAGEGAPAALSTGRIASYPAIAAAGEGFVVAWTDQSAGPSAIHVFRIP